MAQVINIAIQACTALFLNPEKVLPDEKIWVQKGLEALVRRALHPYPGRP